MKYCILAAWALVGFLAVAPAQAQSQLISVGFLGGIPLTDFVNTPTQADSALQYFENTHRYVLGASVELHLPAGFGVELDVLHESYDFHQSTAGASISPSLWQFPIMAKYRILPGPIRPFIEGGVAFSRLTNVSDVIALDNRSSTGIVIGGGVEIKAGFLRIVPELRYNNWPQKFFNLADLQSKQNQATFLVGISF